MIIKLVRHGQSTQNTGEDDPTLVGEKDFKLTAKGRREAYATGMSLRGGYLTGSPPGREAMVYSGPYARHRQTVEGILAGAGCSGMRVIEEVLLAELDHGYTSVESVKRQVRGPRQIHGRFFYRFEGGESPKDKAGDMRAFITSLFARAERKWKNRALIVTSSITLRAFLLEFFHLRHEMYDLLEKPKNGQVITIAQKRDVTPFNPYLEDLVGVPPMIEGEDWGCWGLGLKEARDPDPDPEYRFEVFEKPKEADVKTKELYFYGASDDLFEVESSDGSIDDEFGDHTTGFVEVSHGNERLGVAALYSPGAKTGTWFIAAGPIDDDDGDDGWHMPNWPCKLERGGRGYSAKLTLVVPLEAKIRWIPSRKYEDDE